MSNKSRIKREQQLGMNTGCAQHRLRRMILFKLVQDVNKDICHQCKQKIDNIEDFSIEHIIPWLDSENPKELFFDLNNIAFSHLSCNSRACRKPHRKYFSPEERLEADRKLNREHARKAYTKEKRQLKYRTTGW